MEPLEKQIASLCLLKLQDALDFDHKRAGNRLQNKSTEAWYNHRVKILWLMCSQTTAKCFLHCRIKHIKCCCMAFVDITVTMWKKLKNNNKKVQHWFKNHVNPGGLIRSHLSVSHRRWRTHEVDVVKQLQFGSLGYIQEKMTTTTHLTWCFIT